MKYPKTPGPLYFNGPLDLPLRAKIKLHGTHASVFIGNTYKDIVLGKRSTEIGSNCGSHYDFELLSKQFKNIESLPTNCCIFGEWCGPKIQKKVACSMIKDKSFFIYAVVYEGLYIWDVGTINRLLPNLPDNCYVIPWFNNDYFTYRDLDKLKLLVEEIDKEDPYIKELFNKEGHGEGLVVMNPIAFPFTEDCLLSNGFKVKGESHQKAVAKIAKSPLPDEVLPLLRDIRVDIFEKALEASNSIKTDFKTIGAFLKEVNSDFYAENKIQLDELDQDIRHKVYSNLTSCAKKWFIEE